MNPNHVLLPIDRSVLSLRPIERAPELFSGRKVTLFCAVENHRAVPMGAPLAPPVDAPDLHARLEEAREALTEAAAVMPDATEVQIEVVANSNAAEAIGKYADENDVDLIVLSTHGRTGFKRLAIGSVAEAVLRRAKVPTLVFPTAAKDQGA